MIHNQKGPIILRAAHIPGGSDLILLVGPTWFSDEVLRYSTQKKLHSRLGKTPGTHISAVRRFCSKRRD